jgi:hypothetical protein
MDTYVMSTGRAIFQFENCCILTFKHNNTKNVFFRVGLRDDVCPLVH